MEEIRTIRKEETSEIVIEKSRFISFAFRCFSKEQANKILDDLHAKYPDATHICYAYIVFDKVMLYKSSDDGEPSGTAGAPILNVLRKKEMQNVFVAVVRYFGGIKLGAGGLTRAYSNTAIAVIDKTVMIKLIEARLYDVSFDYHKTREMEDFFRINKIPICSRYYDDKAYFKVTIKGQEQLDILNANKDKYEYDFTLLGSDIVEA